MELSPEQQAAIEQQKAQCPFCQIIAGKIPSKKVYEDDDFLGILDINPATKGHVLFMPKEHYPIMPIIPPETFKKMIDRMDALSTAIKEAILCEDTTILIANGAAAGQRSAHFMLHIIPRENSDNLGGLDVTEKDAADGDIKEVSEKAGGILTAMLNKNLASLGYIDQNTAAQQPAGAPMQKMTKEQLIQVLQSNPQIKEMIEKDPAGFKQLVPTHPQLSQLFADFDIDEIISEITGKPIAKTEHTEEKKQEPPDSKKTESSKEKTKTESTTNEEDDLLDALAGKESKEEKEENKTTETNNTPNTKSQKEIPQQNNAESKESKKDEDGASLDDIAGLFK